MWHNIEDIKTHEQSEVYASSLKGLSIYLKNHSNLKLV